MVTINMSTDGNGNDSGTQRSHLIHDPSSIYYLHPSENPISPLSKYLLSGDNYYTWTEAITKALERGKKLGFITGEFAPPEDATSPEFSAWKTNNSIICSRLYNSVDASIQPSIASHTIAKSLWEALAERYSISDGQRIHHLKSEFTLLRQKGLSVDAYYNKFRALWYELYGLEDVTYACTCSAAPKIRAQAERDKTYYFLMGLDDDQFGEIRTQILGMDPFPTLNTAFYIVLSKAMNFEDQNTGSVDRENFPIEEVFEQLNCTREGLTSGKAAHRLEIFGPNKFDKKNDNIFLKLFCFLWYNPLSWVTPIMAIAFLANGGGNPRDWHDFAVLIVCLMVSIYYTSSFMEENRANVGPKCNLLRDKQWKESEAHVLVPGDIISIKSGDIVPADARLFEGDPIVVDQSLLTGDCLPLTRGPGEEVYSGSTCKRGDIEAVVIATGVHAFFKTGAHHLVDSTINVDRFQEVVIDIRNFCIFSIASGMMLWLCRFL